MNPTTLRRARCWFAGLAAGREERDPLWACPPDLPRAELWAWCNGYVRGQMLAVLKSTRRCIIAGLPGIDCVHQSPPGDR